MRPVWCFWMCQSFPSDHPGGDAAVGASSLGSGLRSVIVGALLCLVPAMAAAVVLEYVMLASVDCA